MSGLPWSKFFWSDYAADPALKICSLAAQGLWMRMLCIAAEHEPVGYVAVNGDGLDSQELAALVGARENEVNLLLAELERRGVFSRDRRGWIYSRRMINETKKARKARDNGKLGGNPTLLKQRGKSGQLKLEDKREDKGGDKPHIPEARVQEKERDESLSKKTRLSDDWKPDAFGPDTEAHRILAAMSADERKAQLESFRDHHLKEGSRFVDWQAAWGTWIRNSERFARERRSTGVQHNGGNDYLEHVVQHVIPSLEGEQRR
jgi:hypothetical protein